MWPNILVCEIVTFEKLVYSAQDLRYYNILGTAVWRDDAEIKTKTN